MTDTAPHERLATAVASLFEHMDDEADEAWDSLTGLQIVLLREIAKEGRTDRTTLALETRTQRAAATPGLASLLRKGLIAETQGADGAELLLTDAGRRLLDGVRQARASWLRRVSDDAEPPMAVHDVGRLSDALERFTGGRPTGSTGHRGT
jgi:DNA-binding MarR family transcriptional regulator